MTAKATFTEEALQDTHSISLWTLHKNLTRLAEELADAARKTDRHPAEAPVSASAPRDYFAALLRQRRSRDRYFGNTLFGEPAWDIMLELMIARIDGREITVSELGAETHAPGIVTREYVDALADAKLVEIYQDAGENGDCHLALSSEAARRMAELYRARAR